MRGMHWGEHGLVTRASHVVAACFGITLLLLTSIPSHAQSVFQIDWNKPEVEYQIGAGTPVPSSCPVRISMRMSNAIPASACYQSVRFRVRPVTGKTFPADGNVTIRWTCSAYGSYEQVGLFQVPVRAGNAVAESGMLVRLGPTRSYINIEGAWNGRSYANLSSRCYVGWPGFEFTPMRLLLVSAESVVNKGTEVGAGFDAIEDSDFPFSLVVDPGNKVITTRDHDVVECVADVARMPNSWLHLAHFEEVCTSLPDFRKLDASGQKVLSHYVWCGGKLRILNALGPSDLEGLFHADWDRSLTASGLEERGYRVGLGQVVLGEGDGGKSNALNFSDRSRLNRLSHDLNDDYWNWLIPEVGKTPIWAFLGIVILIVGVGAPAILFWSQRIHRRIWTILAIPILSLASILALFLYAAIKDGSGSLARIRSITTVDSDGNGAVWSRQSYFASSIPGGRIRIDAKTEFIPLRADKPIRGIQYQDETGKEQIYSGFLPLRQQKQVSIAHWVSDVHILRMTSSIDSATGMPVTKNVSDSTILAVVCSDASGRLYRADNIPPGGDVTWRETDAPEAAPWLRSFYDTQGLHLPQDAPESRSVSFFSWMNSPYSVPSNPTPLQPFFQEEDYWIKEISNWGAHTPYKFAAFVDRAPQLEKCLPNARETASLHMVVGHWRRRGKNTQEPTNQTTESTGKGLQQQGFGEE